MNGKWERVNYHWVKKKKSWREECDFSAFSIFSRQSGNLLPSFSSLLCDSVINILMPANLHQNPLKKKSFKVNFSAGKVTQISLLQTLVAKIVE